VLCHFEGKTIDEAARELGCPPGTVGTRLARARERLRGRLARRGVTLSAATLVAALGQQAAAATVPAPLVASTVAAAAVVLSGRTAAGVVSAKVIVLTEGVLHAMLVNKVKIAVAALLVAALCTAVAGWAYQLHAAEEANAVALRSPPAQDKSKPKEANVLKGWGQTIDPDGDCKFTLDQGKLTIKLPGTDHALAFERNQMNAPRVLRDVEGDFIVQVKVSGEYPAGATSVVEGRVPFHGAGLLVYHDDKNYIRLERAELFSANTNINYASWELRQDGKFERVGNTGDLPLTEKEYYLRVERRDGKFYAGLSTDGVRWHGLEPITIDLPSRLRVGVAAGHNTSSGYEVHFTEFRLFRDVK
jgi:regulation of enolase protein 1 (concanavalin A-like superfamily)